MFKNGDIITIGGKNYVITATDGVNYAYAPVEEEPKLKAETVTVEEKPKRRRKAE